MSQLGRPTEETFSIDMDHLAILNWAAREFGRRQEPKWSRLYEDEVEGTVEISRGTFFNCVNRRKVRQPAHEAIFCLILEKGWFNKYAEYQKQSYIDNAIKLFAANPIAKELYSSGGCRFCPVYGEAKSTQRLEILKEVGWVEQLEGQAPETTDTGAYKEALLRHFEDREFGTFQVLTKPWSNGQAYQVGVFGEDNRLKLYGHMTAAELAQFKEAVNSVKIDGN